MNIARLYYCISIFVLVLVTCDSRVAPLEERPELFYSSLSVCHCYRSGMSVLGNLIEYEDDMYRTLFQELRMNCLTKYGTQLYVPSHCNDPDEIGELVDSLYSMGIDINDGS